MLHHCLPLDFTVSHTFQVFPPDQTFLKNVLSPQSIDMYRLFALLFNLFCILCFCILLYMLHCWRSSGQNNFMPFLHCSSGLLKHTLLYIFNVFFICIFTYIYTFINVCLCVSHDVVLLGRLVFCGYDNLYNKLTFKCLKCL